MSEKPCVVNPDVADFVDNDNPVMLSRREAGDREICS